MVLRLRVADRGDGGVRVTSDDVPGLLASARSVEWLWDGLSASIKDLLRANRGVAADELSLGPPPVVPPGGAITVEVEAHTRSAA